MAEVPFIEESVILVLLRSTLYVFCLSIIQYKGVIDYEMRILGSPEYIHK